MIDPALFQQLMGNIEEDSKTREQLTQIIQNLEKHVSYTQGVLSRVHSTPRSQCMLKPRNTFDPFVILDADGHVDPAFLSQVEASIAEEVKTIGELAVVASQHPYYK